MSYSSSSGSEEEDECMNSYRKGGYHAVRVGDTFAGGRFIAQRKLGWGQFSTVWLAFDSQTSEHLALMMEILGKMPRKIAIGGLRSKDYFDRYGDLKRIRRLKHFPLTRLLTENFKFSVNDGRDFADFLVPILDFAPEKRPTAEQCLQHPWLNKSSESGVQKLNSEMYKQQI